MCDAVWSTGESKCDGTDGSTTDSCDNGGGLSVEVM